MGGVLRAIRVQDRQRGFHVGERLLGLGVVYGQPDGLGIFSFQARQVLAGLQQHRIGGEGKVWGCHLHRGSPGEVLLPERGNAHHVGITGVVAVIQAVIFKTLAEGGGIHLESLGYRVAGVGVAPVPLDEIAERKGDVETQVALRGVENDPVGLTVLLRAGLRVELQHQRQRTQVHQIRAVGWGIQHHVLVDLLEEAIAGNVGLGERLTEIGDAAEEQDGVQKRLGIRG